MYCPPQQKPRILDLNKPRKEVKPPKASIEKN